jgi:hypothetical protein
MNQNTISYWLLADSIMILIYYGMIQIALPVSDLHFAKVSLFMLSIPQAISF